MTNDARLAGLVATFNLRPDRYIDASWLPADWPLALRDPVRYGEAGRAVLARALLQAHQLHGEWDYDFAAMEKRVALLPADALERLAVCCGLCLHRQWLREGEVSRKTRQAIDLAFGAPLVAFALERMPAFEAVAETLQAQRQYPRLAVETLRARGRRLLTDFLVPFGPAVIRRLALKFPRNAADADRPPYLLGRTQRAELGELLRLSLIPEQVPAWDWLF
ncbi:SctK family type III secretion system sorting platform protein [Ralstonia sp. GX3-BWBA]|uniref:SctK family type III secretion system sorting platform protein n=1 Tax=Ralstonia sp. GX3-BWBA TaxID=2219865 RepID=UPI0013A6C4BE|nr:SctK family type III secretion system sorting platform protein [Ralstonia sp. GX3-BWBA]